MVRGSSPVPESWDSGEPPQLLPETMFFGGRGRGGSGCSADARTLERESVYVAP